MLTVDLNCDMGESSSFFRYDLLTDLELMKHISSVNIACGAYAGDPQTMQSLVAAALERKVAIGAHPGFEDQENFGRKEILLPAQQIYNMVLFQLGALDAFLRPHGKALHHVKPHGALYSLAARDPVVADAISAAARDFSKTLLIYGLAGSEMTRSAERHGLRAVHEVFADRTYQPDGSLTPRSVPNSMVETPEAAVCQALNMLHDRQVIALTGSVVAVRPDTICIHGDGARAADFARAINHALRVNNIALAAPFV